jgi:hypothetical protein
MGNREIFTHRQLLGVHVDALRGQAMLLRQATDIISERAVDSRVWEWANHLCEWSSTARHASDHGRSLTNWAVGWLQLVALLHHSIRSGGLGREKGRKQASKQGRKEGLLTDEMK